MLTISTNRKIHSCAANRVTLHPTFILINHMDLRLIHCTKEYAAPILEILNEAIVNSTSLYDYEPRTLESMELWFDVKIKNSFPVIGLLNNHNKLVAFGTYGAFRAWPAYKYTVEHSLYVHAEHRGKGYGKIILQEIINDAKGRDYHNLIAGIDSKNTVSKKLHESFGFVFCGQIAHAGYKFSSWLDLDFYQLLLSTPLRPKEG